MSKPVEHSQTADLVLDGCRPVPLAQYLKALGVLRLVAEQKDADVRGFWHNDRFVLRTKLGRSELEQFFLEEYRPTPIVAPWNGGSGFHPKDNKVGFDAIAASQAERLACYRETLASARKLLTQLDIDEKVAGDRKLTLLQACRSILPDEALCWVDAVYLLTDEGAKYPPLLGTGGNDGRLDFTNNYMRRLLDVLDPQTGLATAGSRSLLAAALFDEASKDLLNAAIGQFMPGSAGGANAVNGFEGGALVNPWDFVLMLEGATAFATAAVRKLGHESGDALSYPFTVRPVGAGYASAANGDEANSRAEMWMPLWAKPASAPEVLNLLSEGRAYVGRRSARTGTDFARAVASLGVDRGIDSFQRYGFQVRNGLAYLSVPLGRLHVRAGTYATLVNEIDGWLDLFRRKAGSDKAPTSAQRVLRKLETAILELCERGDNLRLQEVLISLGRCERVMAQSPRWTTEAFLSPVPLLSSQWLTGCDDGSIELRLAAALASISGSYKDADGLTITMRLRQQLEPVSTSGREGRHLRWHSDAGRDVAWRPTHLEQALNACLSRRLLRAVQSGSATYPDRGRPAALDDIAEFIEARVDDRRLEDLLWGLSLLDWSRTTRANSPAPRIASAQLKPTALYALMKLCFDCQTQDVLDVHVPLTPAVHRLAARGDGSAASHQAIRRLRASGLAPAISAFQADWDLARRSAAALLFPVSKRALLALATMVLRPAEGVEGAAGHLDPSQEEATL